VVVSNGPEIPDLEVLGLKVFIHWPDDGHLPKMSGGRSSASEKAQE
jgi:hypothetical protein